MKIVKENINFERGQEPKKTMGLGLLKAIENKGVEIDISWDSSGREEAKLEANAKILFEAVELLLDAGVKPENLRVTGGDVIYAGVWKVMDTNIVKNECLIKEDAEILLQAIKDLSVNNYKSWKIDPEMDTKMLFVRDIIPWLKDIKNLRKKYNKL